jgi:acetyltransferase-like isoleucine patch superfamily enzyme
VVLKDVELGDRCVVAAGAVVTKSFAAGSVIAGVPARLLKMSVVEV